MNGLATLDDPRGLIQQIAFLCNDEKRFRNLLMTVEPDKRHLAYESLRPHIRNFVPKPLDEYIIEARQEAERLQLPEFDQATNEVREWGTKAVQDAANRAVLREVRRAEAKGNMELVCGRCTLAETFFAANKQEAIEMAKGGGWTQYWLNDKIRALCPKCSTQ